jgi:F0F1-type ATP synthase assembly protein I
MSDDAQGPRQPLAEAAAWNIVAYLLSGIALYGGIGHVLDRWLGTSFLVLIGMLAGAGLALYLVNVRYGAR